MRYPGQCIPPGYESTGGGFGPNDGVFSEPARKQRNGTWRPDISRQRQQYLWRRWIEQKAYSGAHTSFAEILSSGIILATDYRSWGVNKSFALQAEVGFRLPWSSTPDITSR